MWNRFGAKKKPEETNKIKHKKLHIPMPLPSKAINDRIQVNRVCALIMVITMRHSRILIMDHQDRIECFRT